MSDENRRRLRLLPEVLPDPMLNRDAVSPKVTGGGDAPARPGPRDRTLTHMQRLFATAAAASAVAACGDKGTTVDTAKPEPAASETSKAMPSATNLTQTDPVPPPSATVSSGTDPVNVPPDAGVDAGVKKVNKPPPPPPTHYMVVDPVPTPFRQPPSSGTGSNTP